MASYSRAERRLCKLLHDLRVERGLTQIELGEKVGQPQQVVSKIEKGHRRLYATQLFEYVSKGYGLSVVEFAELYQGKKPVRSDA